MTCNAGSAINLTSKNDKTKLCAQILEKNAEYTKIQLRYEEPRCIVFLRNSTGRLGNRLFMFASAYGLAKIHGCLLYIEQHILNELQETFDFTLANQIKKEQLKSISYSAITSQYNDCKFDPKLTRPEAIKYFELRGYWQTYGYFSPYLDEIRAILTFKPTIVQMIYPFINSILPNVLSPCDSMTLKAMKRNIETLSSFIWIGIHVRRGDSLYPHAVELGYTVPSVEFLNEAMAYFTRRYYNRTLFIVASDDKPYCREIFKGRNNVIITPLDFSPAADLATLTLCKDVAAASGTYGWWAAVLAGGIVLYDERYPRRNSTLEKICPRDSFFPPWFLFL